MTPNEIEEVRALLYKCEGLFTEKGRERINALCDMAARYAAVTQWLIEGRTQPLDRLSRHAKTPAEVDAAIDAARSK